MRVLLIAQYGYVRVLREALALQERGHHVAVLCAGDMFGRELLGGFGLYRGHAQLARVVQDSRADLFHVFNEPDTLVPVVKATTGNRPVVFDVQDLQSLRTGEEPSAEERAAFTAADGVVHVSEPCRAAAEKWHGKKPSALLACYVNRRFSVGPSLRQPCWGAVVYEGAVSTSSTTPGVGNIRGLEEVVRAFTQQTFEFHLFPAGNPPPYGVYENLGAVVHGGLPYASLLRALQVYGMGFVGFPFSTPLGEAALPNKLFEYMSQGVVPVVLNAGTAGELVEQEGVGVQLRGLEGLHKQLFPKAYQCRKRLLVKRWRWTMEEHIGRVEELYKGLLS